MIEFEVLSMKTKTNDIYVIFLLKKNVRTDIIKMILGYPPMAVLETLKEWKIVITSVGQGYESMKSQHGYKMETGVIYRDRGAPIDIGKSRDNFDIDGKLRYFNYNTHGHMARDCQRLKKEKETRKYYKYNKVKHLVKTTDQDKR